MFTVFVDNHRMNKSIALMTLLAVSLFSTGAEAASTLSANQALNPGEQLVSANGAYILTLQATDGNLVVYRLADMKAIWATNVPGGTVAYMQQDRNFVVYKNSTTATSAIWASNTGGNVLDTGVYLIIKDNGSLAIITSGGQTIWSTTGDGGGQQPQPYCGDGICSLGETSFSCSWDCRSPICGNGTCDIAWGENMANCYWDCR
ncbi:hypothetical protein JRI60_38800 [Archangium violaceum]|uniref:hypothetical protein n=1 Tax=Archangium violaceum TaxID=83451 RepID=UPI001950B3CF|nr:hypothetical protein [Archangium violaceum]QRN94998.1 hypothetical protein JRI60_38800 [Archangium violaceum]